MEEDGFVSDLLGKGVAYHLVSIVTGFCFCETNNITKVKTKNFRTVCDRGINSSSEISVK